ncbi:MAG: hypothetical protein AAB289_04340, partial [Chloroflexota bacterium]
MTTSPAIVAIDRYRADYEELSRRLAGEPAWLRDLRRQAWAVFQDTGLPTATRGNERWKYTPVGSLARNEFGYPFGGPGEHIEAERLHHLDPWGPGWTTLFFVDGHFAPHLSFSHITEPGVTVDTLAQAIAQQPALVQSHLGKLVDLTLDGFHALNSAFLNNGAVIHIPAGIDVASPIHCAFIASGSAATRTAAVFPRVLAVLAEGARATLVESYISLAETPGFTDAIVEVSLDRGAKL